MRIKIIDADHSGADITEGKIYDILGVKEDLFLIFDDKRSQIWINKDRVEVVKAGAYCKLVGIYKDKVCRIMGWDIAEIEPDADEKQKLIKKFKKYAPSVVSLNYEKVSDDVFQILKDVRDYWKK